MIIDAAKRRAEYYWFLIIIFFAPLGGLVYFFVVKLKDLRPAGGEPVVAAKPVGPSLGQLRELALESPSIANRLAYGDALRESGKYREAVTEYEFMLHRDSKCKEALHGIALCHIELGAFADAVERLSQLMDIDARYRDFRAAFDYAEALWLDGRRELALEVLEDIATTSTRIEHSLAFANYLALAEDIPKARTVLESALKDYEQSPTFVQRRDRGSAREAEKLLAQLG
ncbi:MAG: hypothetical protein BWY17_04235 [Deltaproteobacteria bacterium ADurb.Bin207]|jgi:hypothetical protein|nr:MAG: hypothetical protein BWY17_04235 [Deltaproteobacteria bacterium ADurb.Bin207]